MDRTIQLNAGHILAEDGIESTFPGIFSDSYDVGDIRKRVDENEKKELGSKETIAVEIPIEKIKQIVQDSAVSPEKKSRLIYILTEELKTVNSAIVSTDYRLETRKSRGITDQVEELTNSAQKLSQRGRNLSEMISEILELLPEDLKDSERAVILKNLIKNTMHLSSKYYRE